MHILGLGDRAHEAVLHDQVEQRVDLADALDVGGHGVLGRDAALADRRSEPHRRHPKNGCNGGHIVGGRRLGRDAGGGHVAQGSGRLGGETSLSASGESASAGMQRPQGTERGRGWTFNGISTTSSVMARSSPIGASFHAFFQRVLTLSATRGSRASGRVDFQRHPAADGGKTPADPPDHRRASSIAPSRASFLAPSRLLFELVLARSYTLQRACFNLAIARLLRSRHRAPSSSSRSYRHS